MKRWTKIFKALANRKRLEIIQLLSDGEERPVKMIAAEIHVTMPGTSRHLSILTNVDVLDSTGKEAHVYYYLNPKMPSDIKRIVDLALN